MGYSRRTLNYPERITISNLTHMMSLADPISIGVETLRIDSGCSLEQEVTELISMIIRIVGATLAAAYISESMEGHH